MKAVDVRSDLVRALRLDAIGPDPSEPEATEALPQSPSEWYLTGFLVPYQAKAEDRQDPTSNEDVDEGGTAVGGDDPQEQEKPSARRAFLPSSLGLSVLVPKPTGLRSGDGELGRLPAREAGGGRAGARGRERAEAAGVLAAHAAVGRGSRDLAEPPEAGPVVRPFEGSRR